MTGIQTSGSQQLSLPVKLGWIVNLKPVPSSHVVQKWATCNFIFPSLHDGEPSLLFSLICFQAAHDRVLVTNIMNSKGSRFVTHNNDSFRKRHLRYIKKDIHLLSVVCVQTHTHIQGNPVQTLFSIFTSSSCWFKRHPLLIEFWLISRV